MIKAPIVQKRTFLRRAAALFVLLPLAGSLTGCVGPCGAVPIVLLPLVLPPALIADAIESNQGPSNADFILAGEVVDDHGEPIGSADAQITAWVATHGKYGVADQWKTREERQTLGPRFRIKVKKAQTLDIVLHHPGYRDQRIVFTSPGGYPPSVQVRHETQTTSTGPTDFQSLEGGGKLYETWGGCQFFEMEE